MDINKINGLPLYQNISMSNSVSTRVTQGLNNGRKSPKAGISALKQSSRNQNNTTVKESKPKPNLGIYSDTTPPPSKMPNLHNQSLNMFQSTPLGGGGLSRASGMSLGRHQI